MIVVIDGDGDSALSSNRRNTSNKSLQELLRQEGLNNRDENRDCFEKPWMSIVEFDPSHQPGEGKLRHRWVNVEVMLVIDVVQSEGCKVHLVD